VSAFRSAFIDGVEANRGALPFAIDVRNDDDLLRIVLTLDQPAFDRRKEVDEWMFGCTAQALAKVDGAKRLPLYRGVDRVSFERALRAGIDVEPTDAHWYGADLEKALEYGGAYPAVLIIDGNRVERPYRNVAVDASDEAHREAKAWARGTPILSENGQWLKYSRLPESDNRRGSPYEAAHSWYIPGDAREALLGVIECMPRRGIGDG
jgi:hypothetical protein